MAETERCGDYTGGWRVANQVHPGPKCACTNYLQKTYCSTQDGLCYRSQAEASTTSGGYNPFSGFGGQNEACKASGCTENYSSPSRLSGKLLATTAEAPYLHALQPDRGTKREYAVKATVDGCDYNGYIVYECVGHAPPRSPPTPPPSPPPPSPPPPSPPPPSPRD